MKLHAHQIYATAGSGLFALGVILAIKDLLYAGIPVALLGAGLQALGLFRANQYRNNSNDKPDS